MIHEKTIDDLSRLFQTDETAWLERMAALASEGEAELLDLPHLAEYLSDMARRDKREVLHRMVTLLVHLLKWDYQPQNRSGGWQATIHAQRDELQDLLESGTLRAYAEQVLSQAYERAVRRAILETNLDENTFPAECPFGLDQILNS